MACYTENHYKPFIKGKLCNKWSGSLPVNYGNEKSNPTGKKYNIYSSDTTQGCQEGKCLGCYGFRLCQQPRKNFGWVKNVHLHGKPKGNPFIWTVGLNPIPEQLLESSIGFNITIDPMREIPFVNNALRAIKALGPRRAIVCFRVYPNNKESSKRCLAIASFLRKRGYKRFIQVVVRLFSKKQAKQADSIHIGANQFRLKRKWFYKTFSVKGLGLSCGSLGLGKCIDCMYCYKQHKALYRIGTSSDPLSRPAHTVKEFIKLGWI